MYINTSLRIVVAALLLLLVSKSASAQTAKQMYALAVQQHANGRWSVAEAELKQFLQQYPQDKRAGTGIFLLAESLAQQGKYTEAKKGFKRLIERDPQHRLASKAIFRTGECSYLAGQLEEAGRQLQWFREHYPNDELNAYVLNYLGEIALAREEANQGRLLYEEAIQRFPKSNAVDQCRLGLGRTFELLGEPEQARRQYCFLANAGGSLADDAQVQIGISYYNGGQYERARAAFSAAVRAFPDSELATHARYWLGMTHFARRQWTEATQVFAEAANGQPAHVMAPAIQYWLAEAYRHNDQSEIAKAHHGRVCDDWPDSQWADDSLQALIQMAIDSADQERTNSLARQFDERYPNSPLRPRVKQVLGRYLLDRRDYARAVETLREAIQPTASTEPDTNYEGLTPVLAATSIQADRANWYYLALAYLGTGQYEEALESLSQVHPREFEKELIDGRQFVLAMAYIGLERHADAIGPLRRYLASQPNGSESPKCRIQLAVALAHAGQLNEAYQAYGGLTEGDREHTLYSQATLDLAEMAYGADEYEPAKRLFTTLTLNEHSKKYAARGWSGVGWCNYKLGQSEAASKAFKLLVQGYPQSELASEAAMMQAKCLQELGQLDKAVETYLMVVTTFESSEHAPFALFEAAHLQERLERKGEAASLLERLAEEHPTFPRLDSALYQLGWLLVDLQKNDRADVIFERIFEQHPKSRYWADATYRLAERAASAEQLDRADQLAQLLIDTEHCDAEILGHGLFLKGQMAASAERWGDVDKAMQRLVSEFPDSQLRIPADYWIAESLFRREKYDEAGKRFLQLREKVEDRQDEWLVMIPLRRAQILAQGQQWQEAYDLASGIQARFPEARQQYEADFVIGRCLAAHGKYDLARESYRSVIRSPEGGATETAAMAHWMIGESYMQQKNYEKAIYAYQGVENLTNYPRWQAAAMLQAGKCHTLRDEHEEAANVFARLVEQHPETTFAQEASQRLERLKIALDERQTANS